MKSRIPGGGGRGPFGPFGPEGPRRFDHGGWDWLHGLFGLLLVAAIVALIVFLLLRLFERNQPRAAVATGPMYPPPPRPAGPPLDPALAELRLRYARGEVSRDDFLRISTDLGAPPPPPPPAPPVAPPPAAPPTPPEGSPPAA